MLPPATSKNLSISNLLIACPMIPGQLSHTQFYACHDRSATRISFLANGRLMTAIARGARGIVFKHEAIDGLVDCVRAVAAGRYYFPSDLVTKGSETLANRCSGRERSNLTLR